MSKNAKNSKQRACREFRKAQKEPSSEFIVKQCIAIAVYAARVIWKSDATNPKLEAFICEMLKVWELLGNNEVSLSTILDSIEMESKIRFDLHNDTITNLKAPK